MKIRNIFAILVLFLSFNIISSTPSEAHRYGGWHGGWHHRGGGWGWYHPWGWSAPLVVEPFAYYAPYYAEDPVTRAYRYIAVGRQKIRQGRWYINNGDPDTGYALINQGQALIARGNAILGR